MKRALILLLMFVAAAAVASPAIYLPGLVALDAGQARHFLRRGMRYFDRGEYLYSLEQFDTAIAQSENSGVTAFAHMWKGRAFYGIKNYTKAKAEFEAAFSLAPESTLVHAAAGASAFTAGQFADALSFFEAGMKRSTSPDLLLNNFAWFRATCPDASFRNGREALRFARQACQLSGWKDSVFIDTLAAAEAETGSYAAAAASEQRALADKDAARLQRSDAEMRMRQYQRGQPYRAKNGR